MNSSNQINNADDDALGALLVHISSSVHLLLTAGVPSGGIAKALLVASVSQGKVAIGATEFAAALRQVADEIDADEALKAARPAGSA